MFIRSLRGRRAVVASCLFAAQVFAAPADPDAAVPATMPYPSLLQEQRAEAEAPASHPSHVAHPATHEHAPASAPAPGTAPHREHHHHAEAAP